LVNKDIPSDTTAVGVPIKIIKKGKDKWKIKSH
jgi:acetyltransferase-like isoleucine patch superfamily enzyme